MERREPISVVVVDDHALFRAGLISLLSTFPEFRVVGEAGNGKEALEVIARTQPEIVLLDVNMPVMDGVKTVQALRQRGEKCRVVMLTISRKQEDLVGALRAGAQGYLLKNAEPEELRRGMLNLAADKGVLSPDLADQVIVALRQSGMESLQEPLTERELEVLRCLADGMTTAQIARHLIISVNTVKTHVRNILSKLDASNRTEAVRVAIQRGLVGEN
ncbi:MAG: DNA-binding response regulator [Anaerolineae bacterium]|nr:MAG: DNA-binding response regulator [Anaerolineae bacterium]